MHLLQPPTIDNVVIVSSLRAAGAMIPPQLDEVSFTIHRPPLAQNGWKLAWRNRRRPVLYDSLHNHKAALGRSIIKKALIEFEQFPCPLFSTDIRIELTFVLRNGASKDIDNMMKYVFDAMQGILYANDASIMVAIVKKVQADNLIHQENESTTVKISRILTTVTTGHSTII